MAEFDCKIIDNKGSIRQTVITANSKFEIFDSFEDSDEFVLSVKQKRESFDFKTWWIKLQKPKGQEIEHFTSQLSALLNAGVPLLGSLEALKDQAESDYMKLVIQSLYDDLNGGASLSQAMGKFPRVFGLMYINMIEAGEKAGVMDTILKRLTQFIGKEISMAADIKSAVRYPIIVFGVLIMAFTLAIIFVIPKFATLYEGQGIVLPLPTRILIGFNRAVTDYWMITGIASVIVFVGLKLFFRSSPGTLTKDWIKLHFPVFKTIFHKNVIARFAHMLETLSRSGIQIISALQTVENTVGNTVIARDIAKARVDTAGGSGLAVALEKSKYFPPMTVKMIAIGEQSGSLDVMLEKIAEQYDSEVEHILKRLTSLLEPLMTVVMGVFVILMALGVFLPMWNVYKVF